MPASSKGFSTHIGIIAPARTPARSGNAVSAERWRRILRELGHRVTLTYDYAGEPFDAALVLHARKGAAALRRFVRAWPGRPTILALTGTDLYRDIASNAAAQRSLALASHLVVLQSEGIKALPKRYRAKAHVIYQSVQGAAPKRVSHPSVILSLSKDEGREIFKVLYVGGLRAVKDPLRVAYAVRTLPKTSNILVRAIGPAYTKSYERRAQAEMKRNPRYYWFGEESHARVLRAVRSSDLVVVTSKSEGGANIIAEAIAAGVPILASDMPGNRGMLGDDYAGYFPVGDTQALRVLLVRAEGDRVWYARLRKQGRARAALFAPSRETKAWRELLCNL